MIRIVDEHKCKAVADKGGEIQYITGIEGGFTKAEKRGSWFLSHSESYASAIDFCPWCGEELGPPEKQIWVSREHLECWRLTLQEAAYRDRQSIRNAWTIAGDIRRILVAND